MGSADDGGRRPEHQPRRERWRPAQVLLPVCAMLLVVGAIQFVAAFRLTASAVVTDGSPTSRPPGLAGRGAFVTQLTESGALLLLVVVGLLGLHAVTSGAPPAGRDRGALLGLGSVAAVLAVLHLAAAGLGVFAPPAGGQAPSAVHAYSQTVQATGIVVAVSVIGLLWWLVVFRGPITFRRPAEEPTQRTAEGTEGLAVGAPPAAREVLESRGHGRATDRP